MSASDVALLCGQLVGAWAVGFTGGYLLTQFRSALNSL